jgi:hypothetical protein
LSPSPHGAGPRFCADATRTPPHYTLDTFVPPCGAPHLEMSPGETGGSQYIASPLLHVYSAPSEQPQQQPQAPPPPRQSEPGRQPLYPIFMARLRAHAGGARLARSFQGLGRTHAQC